jgi:DNA (cytosine-5)-methyltransferase 1
MTIDYNIKYIVVDLFAGAGGVSSGIERATWNGHQVAKVIVAINHDPIAITSHQNAHPDTFHFIEDIWDVETDHVRILINKAKVMYPNARVVLWSSASCTHFSKAKAGPKEFDLRNLPNSMFRYIEAIDPDMIFVENVTEFMDWGPLDSEGYAIPEEKGKDFNEWVANISNYGYNYGHRVHNAADFGAYTSRVRYFGAFVKPGIPFSYPIATHNKNGDDGMLKWKPVKEVLDLDDHGTSMFGGRIRSDKTFGRVLKGLQKFHGEEFLSAYYGNGYNINLDVPCGTLTTKDRFSKVKIQFFDEQYGNGSVKSLDKPSGAFTTVPKQNLVTCQFMDNPQWGGNSWSIDRPSFTLVARMDKAPPGLISAESGKGLPEDPEECEGAKREVLEYMSLHGIKDIMMRPLKIPEMLDIMGFGKEYPLAGNQTEQKRGIGNAVVCDYPQVWFEKLSEIEDYQSKITV